MVRLRDASGGRYLRSTCNQVAGTGPAFFSCHLNAHALFDTHLDGPSIPSLGTSMQVRSLGEPPPLFRDLPIRGPWGGGGPQCHMSDLRIGHIACPLAFHILCHL